MTMREPEQPRKFQNWESASDGIFGGYDSGGYDGSSSFDLFDDGEDFQDTLRKEVKRKSGYTPPEVKFDPALKEGVRYKCGHPNCPDRLLVGIRNSGHIKYTIANIEAVGWKFHESRQHFLCPTHKHEAQAVDLYRVKTNLPTLRRDEYGRELVEV